MYEQKVESKDVGKSRWRLVGGVDMGVVVMEGLEMSGGSKQEG